MKREIKETILLSINALTLVLFFLFSFILDTPPELYFLRYVGWILLGSGATLIVLSIFTLRSGGTQVLINTGIYAVIRHPLYLGAILMYFSMMFFFPHWIIAIISVVGMACTYWVIILGEQRNIEKFGDAYRGYMAFVPRINLLAGAIRLVRRRKRE
jgi:protein-S-isoprenylcysteine O-methyltransferase Ste14